MSALNAGPRRKLLRELFGRLALSRGVQRLIPLLCLEPHDAGLLFARRTLRPVEIRGALLGKSSHSSILDRCSEQEMLFCIF